MDTGQLKQNLQLWGVRVQELNIPGLSYPSTTAEWRLFRYGTVPRGFAVARVPSYWRDRDLEALQEAIFALPVKLRNPIVGFYALGWNRFKLARKCECSVATVYRRLSRAERVLLTQLAKKSIDNE